MYFDVLISLVVIVIGIACVLAGYTIYEDSKTSNHKTIMKTAAVIVIIIGILSICEVPIIGFTTYEYVIDGTVEQKFYDNGFVILKFKADDTPYGIVSSGVYTAINENESITATARCSQYRDIIIDVPKCIITSFKQI